jgi:hypothetical protein
VEYKMQNANYFGMMKCKMLKLSWVCLVPSKMPNFSWVGDGFLAFFFDLLRPKYKMENGYLFVKIFALCLVPLCKTMGQNIKVFFFMKWETKHTCRRRINPCCI